MTNEKAIECNENLKEYMKITDKKLEYKFLEENYKALNMANQALKQTTWIPCSKELPKPQKDGDKDYSEWVQITLHIGEDNDVVGRAFYCFSEEKWYTHGLGVGKVIAWMPLSEPYEGE